MGKNSQLVNSLKNLQNEVENAQLAQEKSKKELSALELTVAEKDVTIDTLETKLKGMGEALDIQKKNSVNSEVVTKLEQKCQNYLDAIEDYKVRTLILQSQLASHESSYDELITELNAEKAKITTITKENQTNLETLTEMKEKCAK